MFYIRRAQVKVGLTLLTCDMYMSDLRYIHDPVLSSLKMEGISLLFPYPPHPPRCHTCAYITHMKDNVSSSIEIRQVIHYTRISNGQWPRCDFTNLCGACAVR
jgi:hypothetical protein